MCCGCALALFKVCLKVAFVLSVVSDILILKEITDTTDPVLKRLYILLIVAIVVSLLAVTTEIAVYIHSKVKACCCPDEPVVVDEAKATKATKAAKAWAWFEISLTTVEGVMEIAVLAFYVHGLRTTESLNFLRDEIEESTEQFVVGVKFAEALLGCLAIFILLFVVVALCQYWRNSLKMISEMKDLELPAGLKGSDLRVTMPVGQLFAFGLWFIVVAMGGVKLALVIVFGQEVGFF